MRRIEEFFKSPVTGWKREGSDYLLSVRLNLLSFLYCCYFMEIV